MKHKKLLSLKSLIVLGFATAAIPLVFGVIYAAYGLRESSELARSINSRVFEQTKIIRLVLQKSSDIERKARLFVLLSDPALRQPYERESYEATRASFKQSLNDLLKLHVDNKIALLVNELSEKENLIYQQIISSETEDSFKLPIDEAFEGFRDSSNTLSREFDEQVETTFNEMRDLSESQEHDLVVKGCFLLVLVCAIVLALLRILSRSMLQLDNAIRRLGSGELNQPIVVNGPADLHYLGERLEWLRRHFSVLESAKQQLMQNLAREIEQPLQVIRHGVQRLRSNDEAVATQAKAGVDRLQTVSEQLRKYARCQAIPAAGAWQTLDMPALMESSLAKFDRQIRAKSLRVKKLFRPVEIEGIAEFCQSIIDQLLDNAIRVSPQNAEIRILLRGSGDQMKLEIEDDGPGIEPELRTRVFEPFFRIIATEPEDEGNCHGLGLAMVKEYVSHHHGYVEFVDPRQGHHGARVRVKIPLDIDA